MYSLSGDFPYGLDNAVLTQSINDDPGITPVCLRIDTGGDDVYIVFDADIDGYPGEHDILDGLVAAHRPPKPRNYTIQVSAKLDAICNSTYTTVATFKFSASMGGINYIEIIARGDTTTTFALRVVDVTNVNVVATKTGLTNTEATVIDMGDISNVPVSDAVMEVQVSLTSGDAKKYAYCHSVIVYY